MIVVGLSVVPLVAFVAVPLGWMSTWLRRMSSSRYWKTALKVRYDFV